MTGLRDYEELLEILDEEGKSDGTCRAAAAAIRALGTARTPKVRTGHHRNKEEAARLQKLVDDRCGSPREPAVRLIYNKSLRGIVAEIGGKQFRLVAMEAPLTGYSPK